MTDPEEIHNQRITRTIMVIADEVEPSYGLFQPHYPLSEANFLRLSRPDSVLLAASGAIIAYSLSTGLPPLVRTLMTPASTRVWPKVDLVVAGVAFGLSLLLLVVASFTSRERRTVRKAIKNHFKNNPGHDEVRMNSK